MLDSVDPRQRAFDALAPIAQTVLEVLNRVDAARAGHIARNAAARAGWTPAQRKTENGFGRFCDTIEQLKIDLTAVANVRYVSTPTQEASNLFLWMIGDFLTLRVKSEPSDLSIETTEPLFGRESTEADHTVCLSWRTTLDEKVTNVRFVSVHDRDPWSISLMELLADGLSNVESIATTPGSGLTIKSKLNKADQDADDESTDVDPSS